MEEGMFRLEARNDSFSCNAPNVLSEVTVYRSMRSNARRSYGDSLVSCDCFVLPFFLANEQIRKYL